MTKVKDSCEKIQHFGAHKDESGTVDVPEDSKCLDRIKDILAGLKVEYAEVENALRHFYHDPAA